MYFVVVETCLRMVWNVGMLVWGDLIARINVRDWYPLKNQIMESLCPSMCYCKEYIYELCIKKKAPIPKWLESYTP